MAQVCPRQVVVTVDPAVLADAPCTIIRDRWPGQGPMAAFVTAFLDTGAQAILVMAVDLPLVRPKLLELLAFGGEPEDRARTPMGPGGPEPLLAYYHRRALPAAMRLLEKGDKRPRMLLKAVGARYFSPQETAQADPEGLSFFNVNYPEDLQKAHRLGLERGLFDTE
jgi:molybdopterin-guanine dinucleotide biosynthesis protein A